MRGADGAAARHGRRRGRCLTNVADAANAADAAARAACATLPQGTTAAQNVAIAIAANNYADGSPVTLNASTDIQFLNWTSSTSYTVLSSASGANAVRVYARRTAASGNPIPMLFAMVLGKPSLDVIASSVAQVVTTQQETDYIDANSDPWLAGEPAGTKASEPDPDYPNSDHQWKYDVAGTNGGTNPTADGYGDPVNEPYGSPKQVSIPVTPGEVLTISSVSGGAKNDPAQSTYFNADGSQQGTMYFYDDGASGGVSEHGMSDATMPLNSINGVFLSNTQPDSGTVPAALDFTTQASRDYTSISPAVQQVFYIGDGQTSGSVQQQIVVPAGATRFFLGTMDGWEWSNNVGGYTATITETAIETVQ